MEPLYETWRLSPLQQAGSWCSCGPIDAGHQLPALPSRDDDWIQRFVAAQFELTQQLDDLPLPVRSFLKEHCREELAESDQPFNRGDAVDVQFPMRRFMLGGNSRSLVFVWYEHGGRGYHQHLLLFDLAGGKPALVYHALPFAATSFPELKAEVQKGAWPSELESNDEF